jgi:hypothetical protein
LRSGKHLAHVRFGSEADIVGGFRDVRFTPKADIAECDSHVRFVPEADSCTAAKRTLFDHLVSKLLQVRRYIEAKRFGGPEVDDQLELGW